MDTDVQSLASLGTAILEGTNQVTKEESSVRNISTVVEYGLCAGCGTCSGVCPVNAIEMTRSQGLSLPTVDEAKCTSCLLCLKSCPGFSLDFQRLNIETFGKQPGDQFLGNLKRCFFGHTNDNTIRRDSASGGMVTQVLVFALEKGIIDGALVTRMKTNHPLETESFVARTREEIMLASKSKYCAAAPNEALKVILKERGRFAVVGLPCHIHGIRKAEENIRGLREKIILHLGIVCSHGVNSLGTMFLLEKLHVPSEQVSSISYRGHGWPGLMLVRLKDGSSRSVAYVRRWKSYGPVFSSFFFTPERCLMCPDETNELADISFGDAWIPELRKEVQGDSMVIARTDTGLKILDRMVSEHMIFLKPMPNEKARSSELGPLKFKKTDFPCRLAMMESAGKRTPDFDLREVHSFGFSSFVRNMFVLLNVHISESRRLRNVIVHIPLPFFRLFYGMYKLGLSL